MKRRLTLAALLVLLLAGCSNYSIQEVAAARDECHSLDGVFRSWWVAEFQTYRWSCDLSDSVPTEERR